MPFLPPNQQRQSTEGKLVKNLKYAKIGLAVGILDQFVMKTFAPTKSADF